MLQQPEANPDTGLMARVHELETRVEALTDAHQLLADVVGDLVRNLNDLRASLDAQRRINESTQTQLDVLRAGLVKHTYLSTKDAHG